MEASEVTVIGMEENEFPIFKLKRKGVDAEIKRSKIYHIQKYGMGRLV